jgi:helix-turn-helix protein
MSVKVTTWVYEHSRASGGDLLVLLILADHADDESWQCWPSIERIAALARMSERGVRYCLRSLEGLGEVLTERPNRNRSNTYRIVLDAHHAVPLKSSRKPASESEGQSLPVEIGPEAQFRHDRKPSSAPTGSPLPPNHHEPSFEPSFSPSDEQDILLWIGEQCTSLGIRPGFNSSSPRDKRALREADSAGLRSQILHILEDANRGRNVTSLITGLVKGNGHRQTQPRHQPTQRFYPERPIDRQQYDRPKPPSRRELALAAVDSMVLTPSKGRRA